MPKTLVIVATTDLASDQRVQRAAEALHRDGWQVTVLGRLLPTSSPLSSQEYTQRRLKCGFLKGPLFYVTYNFQVAVWLLLRRFSVIKACDADTLLGCTISTVLTGATLAFDAHEYFSELPEVVRRPWVQKAWAWVERVCIPKAAIAYTVGPALAAVFSRQHARPFGVVRNVPLQTNFLGLTNAPIPNRIIYTGAINEGRGLEQLIEALVHLPTYTAVICGDGPLLQQIKLKALNLGIEDRIRFTGRISPQELRKELIQGWLAFSALVPQGESYRLSLTNKFFDDLSSLAPRR